MKKNRKCLLIISAILIAGCILILIPQVQSVIILFAEKFVLHRELRKPDKWLQILFYLSIDGFIITFLVNFLYVKPKYTKLFIYLFVCIFGIFKISSQINHMINNTPNYEQRVHELEFLSEQIKTLETVSFCLETYPGDFLRTQYACAPRKIVFNDTTTSYIIGYTNYDAPQEYIQVSYTLNFKLYKKEVF
ncbi:MAG: hypothetical protein Ta2F_16870 [Termitinemataceae bacterium]|nr:MAG: hypothetical protein Ta2F_16870 [Termitinemataceae bacterium]